MAKTKSTRRKARKPKFIEVEGHQLEPGWHAGYQLCVQHRTRPDRSAEDAQRLGLSDFLHTHRPSTKIKGQLLGITQETLALSLAIGAMGNYIWYQSGSIRAAGCDLVEKLALELYNASAKLTAIAMNVEAEESTKLQDWLAQDERLARIGRGAEVANG